MSNISFGAKLFPVCNECSVGNAREDLYLLISYILTHTVQTKSFTQNVNIVDESSYSTSFSCFSFESFI